MLLDLIKYLAAVLPLCLGAIILTGIRTGKNRYKLPFSSALLVHQVAIRVFYSVLALLILAVEAYARSNPGDGDGLALPFVIHGIAIVIFAGVAWKIWRRYNGIKKPDYHREWAYWRFVPSFVFLMATGAWLLVRL
jgi:hypothetical protein